MKQIILALTLCISSFTLFAQVRQPASWNFSAKKINATTYEIHMTVNLESRWHIYSQTTPDGGPVPTKIKYTANPLVSIDGVAKEVGKMEKKHEAIFGVDVKQYSNRVDFVQVVKLKGKVKTNLSGTIQYMVCDDKECLPPTTQKFSVAIQ